MIGLAALSGSDPGSVVADGVTGGTEADAAAGISVVPGAGRKDDIAFPALSVQAPTVVEKVKPAGEQVMGIVVVTPDTSAVHPAICTLGNRCVARNASANGLFAATIAL